MLKGATIGHPNIPRRSPQWEKATIQKWYRGTAAVTPLDYGANYFIDGQSGQSDKGKKSRFSGTIVTENSPCKFSVTMVPEKRDFFPLSD